MENLQKVNQNYEWNNLKTCNFTEFEKKVVICSNGNSIESANNKEIESLFKYIFVYLGIREYLSRVEFDILIENTKLLLKKYTIQDVKTAFNLATTGLIQYDLKLYDRVFNIVYLCDLMKAYEAYRSSVMLKYKAALEEEKSKEKILSAEEKRILSYNSIKKGCIELFKRYKTNDIPCNEVDLSFENGRYSFLSSLGLFKYEQIRVDAFKAKAIDIINKEKNNSFKNKNPYKAIINDSQTEKEKTESYIKNLMILDYFKVLINSGKELKTEIENAEKTL